MTSNQSPPTPARLPHGQIAGGDVQGCLLGESLGQQTALQREGDGTLAGVAAGVVDTDGGAGRDLLPQQQIVPFEELGLPVTGERGHTQGEPTGPHRHREHRVESESAHAFGTLRGVPRHLVQGFGCHVLDER